MTDPTCPSCNLPVSAAAFDAGRCPCCGFALGVPVPLDEPPLPTPPPLPAASDTGVSLDVPGASGAWVLPSVAAGALVLGIGVGYLLFARGTESATGPQPSVTPPATSPTVRVERQTLVIPVPIPLPAAPSASKTDTPALTPTPMVAVPPKLPGKTILIDPSENPDRKLDAPDGTAEIVDLNGDDRVTLTGRVKQLRINGLHGHVLIDATGLTAEEVVLASDVGGVCMVKLNAPNGKVVVTKSFAGSCKLVVTAPGGEVSVPSGGRIGGGAELTLSVKRFDAVGLIHEGAKVRVTVDSGGSVKVGQLDGGATVTWKRAATTDPAPKVETGDLRSGTKVTEEK